MFMKKPLGLRGEVGRNAHTASVQKDINKNNQVKNWIEN